jgi:hypothetical protein
MQVMLLEIYSFMTNLFWKHYNESVLEEVEYYCSVFGGSQIAFITSSRINSSQKQDGDWFIHLMKVVTPGLIPTVKITTMETWHLHLYNMYAILKNLGSMKWLFACVFQSSQKFGILMCKTSLILWWI